MAGTCWWATRCGIVWSLVELPGTLRQPMPPRWRAPATRRLGAALFCQKEGLMRAARPCRRLQLGSCGWQSLLFLPCALVLGAELHWFGAANVIYTCGKQPLQSQGKLGDGGLGSPPAWRKMVEQILHILHTSCKRCDWQARQLALEARHGGLKEGCI